ncbi:glutathione S-transferase family protein [Amphibiibacter pelophylacis]|uniref:Glutathione S-transferase family protein n=1 Tax=Amphibiibacter pelophylacis TaxID=1799477 RepID=A0ACC6NZI3_9BURK
MPVLYIANKNYSSWSLRPWALMRALDIPFEERLVPFVQPGEPSPFAAFSPTGKVPCLVDDTPDGPITVWDSLAIAEYLAESHPGVWPTHPAARAFARCASAEMHSGFATLRNVCGMNCGVRVELAPPSVALQADLARLDALWQQGLDHFGGPWLAGSAFGAVDAFFAPVAFRVQTYGLVLKPAAQAYAQRLLDHPVLRDWYDQALAEPWRDAAHDAELPRAGRVVADLRRQAGA